MRDIKFRAWHEYGKSASNPVEPGMIYDEKPGDCLLWKNQGQKITDIMQYTGLKDKNGLTDIYEGDILSLNGEVKGNVYESKNKHPTDIVVEGMGTKAWRNTEQEAIRRGCSYAKQWYL